MILLNTAISSRKNNKTFNTVPQKTWFFKSSKKRTSITFSWKKADTYVEEKISFLKNLGKIFKRPFEVFWRWRQGNQNWLRGNKLRKMCWIIWLIQFTRYLHQWGSKYAERPSVLQKVWWKNAFSRVSQSENFVTRTIRTAGENHSLVHIFCYKPFRKKFGKWNFRYPTIENTRGTRSSCSFSCSGPS